MIEEKIPEFEDKLFYKINEVSKITGIADHALRYWEDEFPQLCPQKSKNNIRTYKKDDILLVFKIKKLLKEHKFTIAGAKEYLKKQAKESKESAPNSEEENKSRETIQIDKLSSIKRQLGQVRSEIRTLMSGL